MNNITFREATLADVDGIAKVHVDAWRSTYAGIVPQSYLDSLAYEDKAAMWHKLLNMQLRRWHLIVAVNDSNRIIGFSSGGSGSEKMIDMDGEIFAIYLLKEFHGKGIG
ncbi:MAG: GNAT family N-acetyltransferase, partial [Proteobacteria bacterium]